MAINIGTGFKYKGKKYLDLRQGEATTLEDLKNWSIPVPDGFEVWVNGFWYEYNSSNEPDPELGYFRRRLIVDTELDNDSTNPVENQVVTKKFEEVDEATEELMNEVFKLSFKSFSGGGTFEVGTKLTPSLSWSIQRKGIEVDPDGATVNGSSEGVSLDFKSYTSPSEISSNTNYSVVVTRGVQSVSKTVGYSFMWKKYWGVSEKETLSNSDILSFSSAFSSSRTMGPTKFDCSGGKYPYYVIPANQYDELEVWVGGLKNTAITVVDQNVTNQSGASQLYKVVRLTEIQTSSDITIEFK